MALNAPLTVAFVSYWLAPNAIRCLSLGDTTIELTLTGDVVIDVALIGVVEASLSK